MRTIGIFVMQAVLLAGPGATAAHAGDTGRSLEILMETDGTTFRGVSRKVREGRAPGHHRQVLRKGFYYIEALDAAGRVLGVETMPASNEVLYDYFDAPAQEVGISSGGAAGAPPSGQGRALKGGRVKLPTAQFLLKLPYDADVQTLRIHVLKETPARGAEREHRISGARQAAPSQAPPGRELKATLDLGAIPEAP